MALKYTGDPATDWLPGVPARDLTDAEEKQYPQAAECRFYEKSRAKAQSKDEE